MSGGRAYPKQLIVVVPGILGSVLQDANGKTVWGWPPLGTLLKPGRLHIDEPLTPVDLLREPNFFTWIRSGGYTGQITAITKALKLGPNDIDVAVDSSQPNVNARVMLFPYDFRKGMQHNAERLACHVDARRGNRRVMVFAHSMGGLVARWWWACEGGWKVTDHLYTMGTPHRGAAQALNYLGLGVQKFGFRFKTATEVARSWPSIYELLPRYKAVWNGSEWVYPFELPPTASDLDLAKARAAYKTHRELELAARSTASDVVFRALRSNRHATPAWGWLDNGLLRVDKNAPDRTAEDSSGDGTVPWFSALPVDLDTDDPARAESFVTKTVDRHRALPTSPEALAPLRAPDTGNIRGPGDQEPASLGLDLDDFAPVGAIEVAVRPFLHDADVVTSMFAQTRDQKVDLTQDGDTWRGSLPATREGNYAVRVTAAVKGSTPSLQVQDTVEVIADDQ